jgi:shikimate dehydrogenase
LKRLAVLGHPAGHSRSPAMQNAALADLGLGGDWHYEAIDVTPEEFADRVLGMEKEGFAGANVTVPHKRAALDLADEASDRAREIGAANTLSFSDGRVAADNTDAAGLLGSLPEDPGGKRALVLGAGGAARAVVWGLVGAGAEVGIWNRTNERAAALAAELGGATVEPGSDGLLPAANYELIVNTTTVGMSGEGALAELHLTAAALSPAHTVVDIAYGEVETGLLGAAREAGATVVDGLEMLVRQGAESLRIWTGREPSLEVMREAARLGWEPTPAEPPD